MPEAAVGIAQMPSADSYTALAASKQYRNVPARGPGAAHTSFRLCARDTVQNDVSDSRLTKCGQRDEIDEKRRSNPMSS
ncbi:hypothetical protein, partial [Burkholderia pyrrocinia]|uniref:hypothetical protein n=1 Tax=Burkholderia pyrrocinia TaxID=60550 RepID=UPI001ABAD515